MQLEATGHMGSKWAVALIALGLHGMLSACATAAEAQERHSDQQNDRATAKAGEAAVRSLPEPREVVSTAVPVTSTGAASSSASTPRTEALRYEAARVQMAPRVEEIIAAIREGRSQSALTQARQLATQVGALTGRSSLAVADALQLEVQARRPGSKGDNESRELVRRIVDIRERADAPELAKPRPAQAPVVSTTTTGRDLAPPKSPVAVSDPLLDPAWLCEQLLRADGESPSDRKLYLRCLEEEGRRAFLARDLGRASDLYTRAKTLRLQSGETGRRGLDLAETLFELGRVRSALLDYRGARPLLEQALEIREKSPSNRPLLATTLNDLGNAEFVAGRYVAARSLYERALSIWELQRSRSDVITSLDNLGHALWAMGDYARARPIYEQALSLSEHELGRRSPLLAANLSGYASLLYSTGDFSGARAYDERALDLAQKTGGRDCVAAAQIGNNLGNVMMATGDYERAGRQLDHSLVILEKQLGPEHPDVGGVLTNLAFLAELRGQPDARALYERALAVKEKVLGPEHPSLAPLLTSLARMDAAEGRMADSLLLIERALEVREKALGPDHPDVAGSLVALADAQWASGHREEAQKLCQRAATIQERALGEQHPALAAILLRLSLFLADGHETRRAIEAALRAERISADHLAWTARSLAEGEALLYAATRVSALSLALSLTESSGDNAPRLAVFDAVIRSRALVLDEMATRHRLGLGQHGAPPSPPAQALTSASQRLANLIVRGPDPDSPKSYRILVAEAREARNGAERILAASVAPYRQDRPQAGLVEVVRALPPGSALVSFVRYDRLQSEGDAGPGPGSPLGGTWNRRWQPSYLALVWAGDEAPALVPLGPAGRIDSLVQRWREEAGRAPSHNASGEAGEQAEAACRAAGLALRRQIWDPLPSRLRNAARVFVVPDGALNLLNFAALPNDENGYLVDTGPLFHLLSAERDLLAAPKRPSPGQGLLALGDPDFNDARLFASGVSPHDKLRKGHHSPGAQMAALGEATPSPLARGVSDCGGLGDARFGPLPGARLESAEVAEIWREQGAAAPAQEAVFLTASDATEASFKARAPGRRILHLATHGFFLGSPCATAIEAGGRGVGGLVSATPEPPGDDRSSLQLAGLALAGANHRGLAGPREEDGILTAEEIAALDLTGVEWAVLSACNTGIGNVRAGEGVFGLRRAFEIAGAGTLIMSLWPVEDEATRQWMRALYAARLHEGRATDDAVRSASLNLLRKRREAGLSTHPHYWASFVAAGDWR
jgi:CHAT domain-containing protein/tetratricopeptide (TPR) repeat protein